MFQRVEPTPWGAVVTDDRFPAISDANYARIDVASDEVHAEDVERALLPSLHTAGVTSTFHVVSFHPRETTTLLTQLSALGHRLTWDLVMDHQAKADSIAPAPSIRVEALTVGDEPWTQLRESMALFGIEDGEALKQLVAIERTVLSPGGKRWFGVRNAAGSFDSFGALTVLGGVGYIDNIATFPHARGNGFAGAITAHITATAREHGAEHVCLFADPDTEATIRMYERLGFRPAGHLAAVRGPLPDRR
jgi:ribosomal protein S18 acetylase RimI-like enzyme